MPTHTGRPHARPSASCDVSHGATVCRASATPRLVLPMEVCMWAWLHARASDCASNEAERWAEAAARAADAT